MPPRRWFSRVQAFGATEYWLLLLPARLFLVLCAQPLIEGDGETRQDVRCVSAAAESAPSSSEAVERTLIKQPRRPVDLKD